MSTAAKATLRLRKKKICTCPLTIKHIEDHPTGTSKKKKIQERNITKTVSESNYKVQRANFAYFLPLSNVQTMQINYLMLFHFYYFYFIPACILRWGCMASCYGGSWQDSLRTGDRAWAQVKMTMRVIHVHQTNKTKIIIKNAQPNYIYPLDTRQIYPPHAAYTGYEILISSQW